MNQTLTNHTTNPEPITFTHKIGSTIYQVNVRYNNAGKESLEEKILRMLKKDLTSTGKYGKMTIPRADWLSERGSI
jgi:hypothetical protein